MAIESSPRVITRRVAAEKVTPERLETVRKWVKDNGVDDIVVRDGNQDLWLVMGRITGAQELKKGQMIATPAVRGRVEEVLDSEVNTAMDGLKSATRPAVVGQTLGFASAATVFGVAANMVAGRWVGFRAAAATFGVFAALFGGISVVGKTLQGALRGNRNDL